MTAPATPPRVSPSAIREPALTPPTAPAVPVIEPWTTEEGEALIRTLPAIASARVLRASDGAVREIHVLATPELSPKQIVRNIESAMLARYGARIDHRAISVAQSSTARVVEHVVAATPTPASAPVVREAPPPGRGIYFEEVEVRRSRSAGLAGRVTLRAGAETHVGEASGVETTRARGELAATAAVRALAPLLADGVVLAFESCCTVRASDRDFAFVVVSGRSGRETTILSGSCEVRDGIETAAALAVLDATERWMERGGAR